MPLIIQKLKLGNGRKVKHISKSINLSSKMSSPVFFTLQLMGQSVQRESLLLHLLKALKYLVLSFFFYFISLSKTKSYKPCLLNLSEDRENTLIPPETVIHFW